MPRDKKEKEKSESLAEVKKNPKKNRIVILLVAVFLITLFFVLNYNIFVAATVNGVPITRLSVIKELEKQGGSQVLDSIVVEKLILQEGSKQGIEISDEKIEEEIKVIEEQLVAQGMDLEQALSLQGQTIVDLKKNVRTRLIMEQLLGDKVSVADEEISTFYEENKDFYPEGTALEDLKEDIKGQIIQQKLAEQYETFIQELRDTAKINLFVFN
ncbi:SurA N-terminal domain-containing protein [Patescibacteria group bacterium]